MGWRQPEKEGGGGAEDEFWYDPAIEPFICDEPVRLKSPVNRSWRAMVWFGG